jgi:hypothetical protein
VVIALWLVLEAVDEWSRKNLRVVLSIIPGSSKDVGEAK